MNILLHISFRPKQMNRTQTWYAQSEKYIYHVRSFIRTNICKNQLVKKPRIYRKTPMFGAKRSKVFPAFPKKTIRHSPFHWASGTGSQAHHLEHPRVRLTSLQSHDAQRRTSGGTDRREHSGPSHHQRRCPHLRPHLDVSFFVSDVPVEGSVQCFMLGFYAVVFLMLVVMLYRVLHNITPATPKHIGW